MKAATSASSGYRASGQREVEAQDAVGGEAGVDRGETREAAHEQAGSDQEQQRDADLGDDEQAAQPRRRPAARRSPRRPP